MGRWYSFTYLEERTRIARADYLRGGAGPLARLDGGIDNNYGLPLSLEWTSDDLSKRGPVENFFLQRVIVEPLFWLGCCDLIVDSTDNPVAFRLTTVGAEFLERSFQASRPAATIGDTTIRSETLEATGGHVIVQPNFDILVYEPISPHILVELDRFAVRQGTGNVLQYHLSRSSLFHAQQQGFDAQAAISMLERTSGRELPQNVRYSMLDWQRQHERITIHEGVTLCQVADAAILDMLLANPSEDARGLQRLAPDITIIPPGQQEAIRRYLQNEGYLAQSMARPTEASATMQPVSLQTTPGQEIIVHGPHVNLYLRGELERFADPIALQKAGVPQVTLYGLTTASLSRAAEAGLTVATIMGHLTALSGVTPLPAELVERLKSGTGHYGTIRLERSIVVRLRSTELLTELLADPSIGPLLAPLSPSDGLACVQEEHLESLRQALAAKGIPVDDQSGQGGM